MTIGESSCFFFCWTSHESERVVNISKDDLSLIIVPCTYWQRRKEHIYNFQGYSFWEWTCWPFPFLVSWYWSLLLTKTCIWILDKHVVKPLEETRHETKRSVNISKQDDFLIFVPFTLWQERKENIHDVSEYSSSEWLCQPFPFFKFLLRVICSRWNADDY